jgi:AcrR family transcriptional regulator
MVKDTKTKILDAAELLFSKQGIAATSVRNIISSAKVNIASIHYHFGCKHEVIKEVYARRILPVNELRLRLLDELENKAAGRPLKVCDIVYAFLNPVNQLLAAQKNQVVLKGLMARIHSEPDEVVHIKRLFNDVFVRFYAAFSFALPLVSASELKSRFSFMIGIMGIAYLDEHIVQQSGGSPSIEETGKRIIQFVTAGFESPAVNNHRRNKC